MVRLKKISYNNYEFTDRDGTHFFAEPLRFGGWKVVDDRGRYIGDYATMADIRGSF